VVLGCYIALCWTLATVISVVQLYIYKDDEAFRDSIVLQNLSTLLVAVLSAVFSVFVSVRLFCLHRRIKTTIKKVQRLERKGRAEFCWPHRKNKEERGTESGRAGLMQGVMRRRQEPCVRHRGIKCIMPGRC
jgi:hypothetical protein